MTQGLPRQPIGPKVPVARDNSVVSADMESVSRTVAVTQGKRLFPLWQTSRRWAALDVVILSTALPPTQYDFSLLVKASANGADTVIASARFGEIDYSNVDQTKWMISLRESCAASFDLYAYVAHADPIAPFNVQFSATAADHPSLPRPGVGTFVGATGYPVDIGTAAFVVDGTLYPYPRPLEITIATSTPNLFVQVYEYNPAWAGVVPVGTPAILSVPVPPSSVGTGGAGVPSFDVQRLLGYRRFGARNLGVYNGFAVQVSTDPRVLAPAPAGTHAIATILWD